jgi:tetratricopeptide (TPR) repeat protein
MTIWLSWGSCVEICAVSTLRLIDLEQAVHADPDNADLRHLLGAHYAQLGKYDLAELELYRAVSLNPQAHVARFQLGLLHLTTGDVHRAVSTLAPLEALDDKAPMKLFKQGIEALIRDDFATCTRLLNQGMAANAVNPALNEDMRLILAKLPRAPEPNSKPEASTEIRTDFSLYTTRH